MTYPNIADEELEKWSGLPGDGNSPHHRMIAEIQDNRKRMQVAATRIHQARSEMAKLSKGESTSKAVDELLWNAIEALERKDFAAPVALDEFPPPWPDGQDDDEETRSRRVSSEGAWACPKCGAVTYNLNDQKHGYCGRCHQWVDDGETR